MRCLLTEFNRRGEVKYVGKIPQLGEGYYIGVKLDEPFVNGNGKSKNLVWFQILKNK